MSRAKKYRAANRKIVVVDDFEWTIRKIPPVILGEVMEATGVELGTAPPNPEDAEKLGSSLRPKIFDIAKIVLPACVVDPKIVVSSESEDELSLEDISITTTFGLLDEIYAFSELTKEAFDRRRKFRVKSAGTASLSDKPTSAKTK